MLNPKEIFGKYKDATTKYCLKLYDNYFESRVYRNFKARCSIIDAAIDGKFANQNSYIADVSPMIIRQDYNTTSAFLWKYFENDPIISLRSIGGTPQQNADVMQNILQNNFVATKFRERSLIRIFDNLSRYGTAASFGQFDDAYDSGNEMVVEAGPESAAMFDVIESEGKQVSVVKSIHPLNVMMDPKANFQSESAYIGFLDTWYVSELFGLLENGVYDQEQLKKAIDSAKKGREDSFWYGGGLQDDGIADYTRGCVHPLRLYTTLNFEGNEQDQTIYYCELIHNILVRCHPAGVSKSKIPIQTGTYYPRPDMWMGNANLEFKMAFQNLKNWLIGTSIESTMKQMDRMVIVRRGTTGLNVADINARHKTGGIVYTDSADPLDSLAYPIQFHNTARTDQEWLNREVNQMIQELSPVVNMQNKYNQGGLNNNTLGAAQMQAGIGEVLFGFVMANVSMFISRIGEVCTDQLQRNLGDEIPYRPSDMMSQEMISKGNILGEFVFNTLSSYYTNEKGERIDSSNMITQVINWQATGNPAFAGFDLVEMAKDWMRAQKGTGLDIDKYYKEPQPVKQQPMVMPGQPLPQAGGMPPAASAPTLMEGVI